MIAQNSAVDSLTTGHINNGVAVTEVTQIFVNKENRMVEALYTFPVPKNASVAVAKYLL